MCVCVCVCVRVCVGFLETGILNVIVGLFLNQGVKEKIPARNKVKKSISSTDIASVEQILYDISLY